MDICKVVSTDEYFNKPGIFLDQMSLCFSVFSLQHKAWRLPSVSTVRRELFHEPSSSLINVNVLQANLLISTVLICR